MTTKPGRIPCVVIACRRTAPADKYGPGTIICCGKCWRLADKGLRRKWSDARRERNRLEAAAEAIEGGGFSFSSREAYFAHSDILDLEHHWWEQIIAQANQARAGIG